MGTTAKILESTNSTNKEFWDAKDMEEASDGKEEMTTPTQYDNQNFTTTTTTTTTTTKSKDDDEDSISTGSGSIYGLPPGHISVPRAIFLISNAALGAGLMNFPEA